MSAPTFKTEADRAGGYPANRFNQRERKLLESVQDAYAYAAAYAGNLTSLGGAAAEAFSISGLLSSDIVMLTIKDNGPNDVSIVGHSPSADSLTITFSADPGAGAVVSYAVLRSRA